MLNETYYEVFTLTEGVCLVVYYFLVAILGSLGNLFVIHASRSYSSFDLDRVTVLFVQHLAIADCLKILFMTIPMLTNTLYYMTHPDEFKWYLPYSVGKLSFFLPGFANNAVSLFIMAVSLHRSARCLIPTRLYQSGDKSARVVIGIIWFLAPLFCFVVFFLPISYNMRAALCTMDLTAEMNPILKNLAEYTNYPLAALLVSIVILANATSLIYTCILTKDHPNTNFRQANLTVLAISLGMVICYSWLPLQIVNVYYPKLNLAASRFTTNMLKFAVPLTTATSLINPVLYTMVNKGFKKFAVKVAKRGFNGHS